MYTTFNPNVKEPKEPNIRTYDWKQNEIYDYEDYYRFLDGRYVKDDDDELLEYAYTHQKDALLETLFNEYDYPFSRQELAGCVRDWGDSVERTRYFYEEVKQ